MPKAYALSALLTCCECTEHGTEAVSTNDIDGNALLGGLLGEEEVHLRWDLSPARISAVAQPGGHREVEGGAYNTVADTQRLLADGEALTFDSCMQPLLDSRTPSLWTCTLAHVYPQIVEQPNVKD